MQSIWANNVLFSTGITLKNRDPTDIASKNTGKTSTIDIKIFKLWLASLTHNFTFDKLI